jgi:hypothetical protein
MNRSYPLRIPEKVIELAESKTRDERTDRATALRRLIYSGAEDYVVKLLEQERISVSWAAELLDVSPYQILCGYRWHILAAPTLSVVIGSNSRELQLDAIPDQQGAEMQLRMFCTLGRARLRQPLLALDELYAVTVRIADEEDAGAAAHGVRFALEVYATGLFELAG